MSSRNEKYRLLADATPLKSFLDAFNEDTDAPAAGKLEGRRLDILDVLDRGFRTPTQRK